MIQEIINNLWAVINANIDWLIVALVIASGYFQKRYMKCVSMGGEAVKTLLVSFVITTIYVLLDGSITSNKMLAKFIFSYFMATSLYDVLIKPITKVLQDKLSKS